MLKKILNIIANKNVHSDDIETYRKYVLVVLFFCLGMFFLFIMGLIAFFQKDVLLGVADFSITLVLGIFVFLMCKKRKHEFYCNILIVITGLFFYYLFIIGGVENTAHVWCYSFPVISSFIVSYKKGLIYSVCLMVLLSVSQLIAHNLEIPFMYKFNISYLIRFFAVYSIITLVSCIAEWARDLTYSKMVLYHKNMKDTIVQLEITRAELRELTNIDPLTKIYNKRFLETSTELFAEKNEAKYIASIFFDIDDFKKYNDYYGHLEGDKVLIQVANLIKTRMRDYHGIFARFGGEEFVFIMKTNDLSTPDRLAEQIIDDLKQQNIEHIHSNNGYVTISIGISHCLKNCFNGWKAIVVQSDEAMYQAKKDGKNTFRKFNDSIK